MGHKVSRSEKRRSKDAGQPTVFSTELFELIADYLFELQPFVYQCNEQPATICCRKPPWKDVFGFMTASPVLHFIGMTRWVVVLTIRTSTDWDTALRCHGSVRELNCLDGCFSTKASRKVLTHFRRLYTLSVDTHSDAQRSPNTGRFAYCTIITAFPSSILRIQIKHAHSPDIKIIETIKEYSPFLEELWLGRCTMFNRSPACEFWSAFPFDHDSYIALEGVEDYAGLLAQALGPLKRLRELHMGIYLAPSTIVLAHRVFHFRQLAAPHDISWERAVAIHEGVQGVHEVDAITSIDISRLISLLHAPPEQHFSWDSCSFCREELHQDRINAERRVNHVLRELTSLKTISWMNWFSHLHLGLSQE